MLQLWFTANKHLLENRSLKEPVSCGIQIIVVETAGHVHRMGSKSSSVDKATTKVRYDFENFFEGFCRETPYSQLLGELQAK